MAALRIIVRGRVQGVGFRYFVQQSAVAAGIAGEVWNRADGGVEMLLEHPDRDVLDSFALAMEGGPGFAGDLSIEPAVERGFGRFWIGPTR